MKKRMTRDDYIKANRKASREAEIENHGHPVSYKRVHQSKKVYNRKRIKATDDKGLPFHFLPITIFRDINITLSLFISHFPGSRISYYQKSFQRYQLLSSSAIITR